MVAFQVRAPGLTRVLVSRQWVGGGPGEKMLRDAIGGRGEKELQMFPARLWPPFFNP